MNVEIIENSEFLQSTISDYADQERKIIKDDTKLNKKIRRVFNLCSLISLMFIVVLSIFFRNKDSAFVGIWASTVFMILFCGLSYMMSKKIIPDNIIIIDEKVQASIDSKFGIPQSIIKAFENGKLLKIKFVNKENHHDTSFCDVTYIIANEDGIVRDITHSGYSVRCSINAQEYKDTIKISMLDKRITYYYGDKMPDESLFIY